MLRRKGKRTALCLALVLAGIFMAGCVVLPTPAKSRTRGQQAADAPHPLTPGKTTRDEIQAVFGPPTAVWEEARVWIYAWDESKGGWFWLVFGGLGGGAGGYERVWEKKIALLRFDGQGVLADLSIEDRPKFKEIGQRLVHWVYGAGTEPPLPAQTVPVLLRVVTSSGGEPDKWGGVLWNFESWASHVIPRFGGFGTGGLVREIRKCEKTPRKHRDGGWVLYLMEPGFHYVTFDLVSSKNDQPVFQFQVRAGEAPVYIGSFHFERDPLEEPSFWNMWDGQWTGYYFAGIEDESDLAGQVAAEILPESHATEIRLPVVHVGPRILSSPHFRWLSGTVN